MTPAKARTADNDNSNSDEANPYQRLFWIVVASTIAMIGTGAYAFFTKATTDAGNYATLTANLQNLTGKVDALAMDVKTGTSNRYTGADAANDRAAIMAIISHNADAIEKLQGQVSDLREFKASVEARGKP